jgi:hypothetical protein
MAGTSNAFIILFGDSSQNSFDDLLISKLTRDNKSPLLSRFLDNARIVLNEEQEQLHRLERPLLPSSDITKFLQGGFEGTKSLHPAVGAARLVLIQLASFIRCEP